MQLKKLKCPTCGANLVPKSMGDKVIMCSYCGTVVYLEEETKVIYAGDISQKERGETELALIALRSRNFEDAKRKFEEAISNNLRNSVAWLGKAAADINLKNTSESLLAFEKAVEYGAHPEMIITWGNYLISVASYYKSQYIAYANSGEAASYGLNDRYWQYAALFRDYRNKVLQVMYGYLSDKVREGDVDSHVIEYSLQLSLSIKDYSGMYDLARKLLSKEPGNQVGEFYRGVALLYMGRYDEAIAALHPLMQSMPNNYNVFVYLAYAYSRSG